MQARMGITDEDGKYLHHRTLKRLIEVYGIQSMLEVGVWKGECMEAVAPGLARYVGVDAWEAGIYTDDLDVLRHATRADMDAAYATAYGRKLGHCELIRARSSLAAGMVQGPFDLVFLDACHEYENVCLEITLYHNHAAKLLCGHDYSWPGVNRAVHEMFGQVNVLIGDVWMVERRSDVDVGTAKQETPASLA